MKIIKKDSHSALVEEFIFHANGNLNSVEWECGAPECSSFGKTAEMFSLDIGPFPSGNGKEVWRPLNNAVLCKKCAQRVAREKFGNHRHPKVYRLIDMIGWLRKLKANGEI